MLWHNIVCNTAVSQATEWVCTGKTIKGANWTRDWHTTKCWCISRQTDAHHWVQMNENRQRCGAMAANERSPATFNLIHGAHKNICQCKLVCIVWGDAFSTLSIRSHWKWATSSHVPFQMVCHLCCINYLDFMIVFESWMGCLKQAKFSLQPQNNFHTHTSNIRMHIETKQSGAGGKSSAKAKLFWRSFYPGMILKKFHQPPGA